jgi:hypothetical protein
MTFWRAVGVVSALVVLGVLVTPVLAWAAGLSSPAYVIYSWVITLGLPGLAGHLTRRPDRLRTAALAGVLLLVPGWLVSEVVTALGWMPGPDGGPSRDLLGAVASLPVWLAITTILMLVAMQAMAGVCGALDCRAAERLRERAARRQPAGATGSNGW